MTSIFSLIFSLFIKQNNAFIKEENIIFFWKKFELNKFKQNKI